MKHIQAITSHGTINYNLKIKIIEAKSIIKYEQKNKFDRLCKEGCPNYGKKWSCPPYAPPYRNFSKNYNFLIVGLLYVDMDQFAYIKNPYLKIKAANSILKSRADKTIRQMTSGKNNYISTGSCRLCKPCRCKLGEKCARPDIKSYSFEALGINVGSLSRDILNHELLWYKKGEVPKYTSVVVGILSNDYIDLQQIEDVLVSLK